MHSRLVALALAVGLPAAGAAEPPALQLVFEGTVKAALGASSALRAAGGEADAARARASGAVSPLLPQFSVDGWYRYVAEVPSLQVLPNRPAVALGAHDNYSIGPAASWTVWDWGASRQAWRGAGARADAEDAQRDLVRRQIRLAASLAYIQAQAAAEQVRLLADALKASQAQYRDISLREREGQAGRTDALQAHQELLARQRGFAQARADLAAALQDLFALTGEGGGLDASMPLDARAPRDLPEGTAPPSLLVRLDSLDDARRALESAAGTAPDPVHPRVRYFDRLAQAAQRSATGVAAGRLPRVQATGRVSLDYPNGPIPEQVGQKTVGLAASMPLFTGTRLGQDLKEQRHHAAALEAQREQARVDVERDWRKASARLAALRAQADLNRQSVAEAKEAAGLVYDSYRGGQARFIEVEAANLHTLETQVQEARTKAEMLIQLAVMQSLSKED